MYLLRIMFIVPTKREAYVYLLLILLKYVLNSHIVRTNASRLGIEQEQERVSIISNNCQYFHLAILKCML